MRRMMVRLALGMAFAHPATAQVNPFDQFDKVDDLPAPDYRDSHLYLDSWQPVTRTASGTVWYVKGRDLRYREKPKPAVWVKQDHSQDRTVKFRESKALIVVDCPANTMGTMAYVRTLADGSVGYNWSTPSYYVRQEPIVPESTGETFARAICPDS